MSLGGNLPTFETSDDAAAFVMGLERGEQKLLLQALLRDMTVADALPILQEELPVWIK